MQAWQPDSGNLIWLDFSPNVGTEHGGRRPALVLSPQRFNVATGLVLVCPVTSKGKGSSFEVALPKGIRLGGYVLSDHLRSLDWIARRATFEAMAPVDTVNEVLARIEAILGL